MRAGNRTEGRLVAAALDLFSQEGIEVTTREIAERAGVNEVTLFRHFATKERLIAAVIRELCAAESRALDQLAIEPFDLERDLLRMARLYAAKMQRHQGFVRSMLAHPLKGKMAVALVREVVEPVRNKFTAYLEEGQRRGLVRKVPARAAIDAFVGAIAMDALRRGWAQPGYSRSRFLAATVKIFAAGLAQDARGTDSTGGTGSKG